MWPRVGRPLLARAQEILQAGDHRAPRFNGRERRIGPVASLAEPQAGAGAVAQGPDGAVGSNDLELPGGGRDRPGLHAAGETQLVGGGWIEGDVAVLDDVVGGIELPAHVGDLRVPDQPGDRVDGMDVARAGGSRKRSWTTTLGSPIRPPSTASRTTS